MMKELEQLKKLRLSWIPKKIAACFCKILHFKFYCFFLGLWARSIYATSIWKKNGDLVRRWLGWQEEDYEDGEEVLSESKSIQSWSLNAFLFQFS